MMQGEPSKRPTPLFVLGIQRSGTTWLANLLGGHSRIVAVESEDHFGVHESIFFSHFARAYGDLRSDEEFERFCRDFLSSDYGILAGVRAADLDAVGERTFAAIFRRVMETLAERRGGARYWLEKSPDHTLLAGELAEAFPDARFVGVVRRAESVVVSRYALHARSGTLPRRRLRHLLRLIASTVLAQRSLARFTRTRPERCVTLRYEDLAADPEARARQVAEFLGLPFEPEMLERRYEPNTSFASAADRAGALGPSMRFLVHLMVPLLSMVPLGVLLAIHRRGHRRRGVEWPDWCWKRRDGRLTSGE